MNCGNFNVAPASAAAQGRPAIPAADRRRGGLSGKPPPHQTRTDPFRRAGRGSAMTRSLARRAAGMPRLPGLGRLADGRAKGAPSPATNGRPTTGAKASRSAVRRAGSPVLEALTTAAYAACDADKRRSVIRRSGHAKTPRSARRFATGRKTEADRSASTTACAARRAAGER